METLDDENQLIAVQKVLEEMKSAEVFVSNCDFKWWEQYSHAYSRALYYYTEEEIKSLENKYSHYFKLEDVFYPDARIGEPLKKVIIEDNFGHQVDVEFGRVEWYGIDPNKSSRYFVFDNNGAILFSKKIANSISYDASYNVLSDEFKINLYNDMILGNNEHVVDTYLFERNDKELVLKLNDFEINRNINTGRKTVRIIKPYNINENNMISLRAQMMLSHDGSLRMGIFAINLHNEENKMSGSYRFEVTHDKGLIAKFVKKGENADLKMNPEKLDELISLLEKDKSLSNAILLDFVKSAKEVILRNQGSKFIPYDSNDFHMSTIKETEGQIINVVKGLKGGIPLVGLNERIDNCLNIMDKKHPEFIVDPERHMFKLDKIQH